MAFPFKSKLKKIPIIYTFLKFLYKKIFLKFFYHKLNLIKISRLHNTDTGKYYLPIFAWEDKIRKKIINNEIYQKEILDIARQYIQDSSVVLDIGANYGQLSILMSKLKKDIKIYSFEAQRFIFQLLKKNTEINNLNIRCFYNLVGNKTEKIKIKRDELKKFMTWGSNNIEYADTNDNYQSIDGIKIDDLNINEKISFMKIDVQGMDLEVLRGAKKTILKHRMPIIFEYEKLFEETYKYTFRDFEEFINGVDYKIELNLFNDYLILPKEN